ncbi:Metallo-beta-lactamase domain-containing protein [Favolaschia claudopus]|uniref:Metallo-beta-lactamase domain-containing protein n=1 Tax=Favolaschia claudopus TaxID=2862362 RepID=A0AAW0EHT2_9AGAR
MEKLEALASVSRLSESVIRVLGQNPGKFTLQDLNNQAPTPTSSGKQRPFTLVDTGEGREEYLPFLESAFGDANAAVTSSEVDSAAADVSDIIISHWHPDHVGGLPSVLALLKRLWDQRNGNAAATFKPPRLHKFPATIPISNTNNRLPSILESLLPGSFTPQSVWKYHLTAPRPAHTPGHTVDSICLHFPQDNALYTADTVLGQGTAVFEDLATYLASLGRMLEFCKTEKAVKLYPGHGPVVEDGQEASVDDVDAGATIYSAYPESLWLPAAHGVTLHLRKLEGEGVVKRMVGRRSIPAGNMWASERRCDRGR